MTQTFINGKVFTGHDEDSFVTAFTVRDGRFEWVGHDSEVDDANAYDLDGRTVLPGFIDAHTHPALLATWADSIPVFLPDVSSIATLLEHLRNHPNLGKSEDTWVLAHGYDESEYPEGRKPTTQDLDQVSQTQPIVVHRADGHSAVCNSVALRLGGVTADTPDPDGARFGRYPSGEPNGLLSELPAIDRVMSQLPPADPREFPARLADLSEHYLSHGIVGLNDLAATMVPSPLQAFREAAQRGLAPRCGLFLLWYHFKGDVELSEVDRAGRVRVAGVKLLMDGAYSDRTAWTTDPYPDSCDHGLHTSTDDDMREAVAWARRNKVQVAIHAMGDRALLHAVEMFEDEEPWMGDRPSIRLEHATLFSRELMDRINNARMSFGVVTHSIFFFAESASYENNLSAQQHTLAYPIRSFYEQVPHLAMASDSPATSWADADNVFVSVKAAVLRRAHNGTVFNADEAVTVAQAVLLYTGRARLLSSLDTLGVIEPGTEASFVVLDRDIFSVPAEEIDKVTVEETWLEGEIAYRSDRAATERVFVR